jgi:D-alanyl-D-alanine carboxypeptidase/D-alanyl-D-alanine-endopeptidase (penicillin-binding protein 4)
VEVGATALVRDHNQIVLANDMKLQLFQLLGEKTASPAGIWMLLILILVQTTGAQPTNSETPLGELRTQLEDQLAAPRFSEALWGVKIASLDTGKIIYENYPDRLMSPASNGKLYSAALALDRLGGDYQFATAVYATSGPDFSGEVRGNVIVCGSGDPSWKATNFWDNFAPFLAILKNAGVRRIDGDLIADNTFFQGPPTGASWSVDDLEDYYGAEISALTLDDNTVQLRVSPGARISDPATLELVQPDTGLVLINQTKTISSRGEPNLTTFKLPGTKTVYVSGQIPDHNSAEFLDVPVTEPAAWFITALEDALAKQGIMVHGRAYDLAWPERPFWSRADLVKLGEVKSPPLRQLVRDFLKVSQNLETDLVFDHLGEQSRSPDVPRETTSEQLAVARLEEFIASRGLPAEVYFDEGSGLSRNDLTSANATVALLTLMSTNRWAGDFYDALPVAGVDGSLRHRMRGKPAFRNVHAKTGTLRWANSLSGYVSSAAGEKLVFSLMLNRYEPPPDRSPTEELDDIVVKLAAFTGRSDQP